METGECYEIAESILAAIRGSVTTEEEFYCVMSCLFRIRHKDAERERTELEDEWQSTT